MANSEHATCALLPKGVHSYMKLAISIHRSVGRANAESLPARARRSTTLYVYAARTRRTTRRNSVPNRQLGGPHCTRGASHGYWAGDSHSM